MIHKVAESVISVSLSGWLSIDLLKSSGEFGPSSVLFEEFKIALLPNGSSVIYSFNKWIEYVLC